MRLVLLLATALILPVLAACDSPTPPAKAPVATPAIKAPAVNPPAAATPTAAPASFPATAAPMLGTWAADLGTCGTTAVTTVTRTSYTAAGQTCNLSLTANRDGSFAATCGNQAMTMIPVFAPTGEGITIRTGSGKGVTVLRCSR